MSNQGPTHINPNPPQSVEVGTSSRQVLAPVVSIELQTANVPAAEAGLVVAEDQLVRVEGRFYWAVSGGTLPSTPTRDGRNDLVVGSVRLRPLMLSRRTVTLTNVGSTTLFLARGYEAELDAGLVLEPGAAHREGYSDNRLAYAGPWYAISDAGGGLLAVSEG